MKTQIKLLLLLAVSFFSINKSQAQCAGFSFDAGPDLYISTFTSAFYVSGSSVSGGTPPYTYSWYSADPIASASLLTPLDLNPVITTTTSINATYCCDVTDALGCTFNDCFYLYYDTCLATFNVYADTLTNEIYTYASFYDSLSPISYLWSPTGETTPNISYTATGGLQTFTCTVSSVSGCSATQSITFIDFDLASSICYVNIYESATNQLTAASTSGDAMFDWYVDGSLIPAFTSGPDSTSIFNYIPLTTTTNYCVTATPVTAGVAPCSYCTFVAGTPCTDNLCGVVFNDINSNGVQEVGELGIPSVAVHCSPTGTFYTDAMGNYSISIPCGTSFSLWVSPSTTFPSISWPVPFISSPSLPPSLYSGFSNLFTSCTMNIGLNHASIVSGYTYVDANSNGVYDATESPLPFADINAVFTTAYSDANGFYQMYLPVGTYNLDAAYTGLMPVNSFSPSTTPITTTTGSIATNVNFGASLTMGNNLSISMIPYTETRPGFNATYFATICNQGTEIQNGTLAVQFEDLMDVNSTFPMYTSLDASTNTLYFNIPNINPGDCYGITFYYTISVSAILGTTLTQTCTLNTPLDIDLSNNVLNFSQIVIGSFDPNNKLPIHSNRISNPNEQVVSSENSNQRIEYVVNFQNTGSAHAIHVFVIDTLSSDVDPSTFQFLGSSHDAVVTRTGSLVRYQFSNIMLADSTNNEPASHGWVRYAIRANAGLPIGHVISDEAAIYFDFNAPVITNDGAVTMVSTIGIQEANALNIALYPNPAQQTVTIEMAQLPANASIEIYDAVGKRVINTALNNEKTTINIAQLQAGIYTCKISSNGTRLATSRITKL
jgi:uncharacterized repeat protein (TIGR01451 family)